MNVHPIIRQIVDRCNVAESREEVCKYAISRLAQKLETYSALPADKRLDFLRQVCWQHDQNYRQYLQVMGHRDMTVEPISAMEFPVLDSAVMAE